MQVIILNFFYEPGYDSPPALLDHYVNLTGWAEGLVSAGAAVTILQRFHCQGRIDRNGVAYQFIADGLGPQIRAWPQPWPLYRHLWAICAAHQQRGWPTVIHLNGLLFPLHTWLLRRIIPPRYPLLLQHHAERPWPAQTRWLQRLALSSGDAFLFTNQALATEWVEQGGLSRRATIHEIMETSSTFRYQPRTEARAMTGLTGEPVILWTGSLSRRKDPLTVLAGLTPIFAERPAARLYMAYLEDHLLPEVRAKIAGTPLLRERVTLLGRLPHAEIETYYNSADFFVQGSHSEGSGIAVLDALACGVAPVITDIPSFRTLTGAGRVGALWPVGEAAALTQALRSLLAQPLALLAQQARDFFETQWHFTVLGRRAISIYAEVQRQRERKVKNGLEKS